MSPPNGRLLGGRYRLGEVVRESPAGTVYRGQDEALGTPVEVRRLGPEPGLSADEQAGRRDVRLSAARRARDLFSRGITPVVDVVEEDDSAYVVSEDVPGQLLSDVLRDGPLEVSEVARLGLRTLDALDPVHAVGLVHGDLRPETVRISDGRVVLSGSSLSAAGDPTPDADGQQPADDLPALAHLLAVCVGPNESPALGDLLDRMRSSDPRPTSQEVRTRLALLAADPTPDGGDATTAAAPRRRRGRVVAAAAAVAVLAAGGALAFGRVSDLPSPGPAAATGSEDPTLSSAGDAAEPEVLPLQDAAPVPAGWSTYEDPDGAFVVAYPPRWQPREDERGAAFVSGTGLSSLLVVHQDDVGAASEEQVRAAERAFAADKQDYELLRLEPTTFRGVPAYEWEATFVEEGVAQRASALGVVVDGAGYLVYLQSTARTWDRLTEVERDLRASLVLSRSAS